MLRRQRKSVAKRCLRMYRAFRILKAIYAHGLSSVLSAQDEPASNPGFAAYSGIDWGYL